VCSFHLLVDSSVRPYDYLPTYPPTHQSTHPPIHSSIHPSIHPFHCFVVDCVWNDGTRAETRFRLSVKRTSPFKSAGASVQSTTCSRGVRMLDTPCSEVVWRVLATLSSRQFPLHFPSRASPCAITFQLDSTSIFNDATATIMISSLASCQYTCSEKHSTINPWLSDLTGRKLCEESRCVGCSGSAF